LIYFFVLIAAALIIALSSLFFNQRKIQKEKQRPPLRKPIMPSATVTSISSNRIVESDQPQLASSPKTTSSNPLLLGLNYKILVVDDQPAIRMMLTELFQGPGIKVFEADKGSTALDIFETQKPNCVLLDLKMPEIDGIDILRVIRKQSPKVPVILITAYADPIKMEEAHALGITQCFTKPFDIIELKAFVLGILEQQSNSVE